MLVDDQETLYTEFTPQLPKIDKSVVFQMEKDLPQVFSPSFERFIRSVLFIGQ